MAFSQQEQDIINYGLKSGKTQQEIKDAIAKLRSGYVPTQRKIDAATTEPKDISYASNVADFATESLKMAGEGIQGLMSAPQVDAQRISDTKQLVGGLGATEEAVAQVAQEGVRGVQNLGKIVGGAAGAVLSPVLSPVTNYISSKIPDSLKQKFATFMAENPEVAKEIEQVADIGALAVGPVLGGSKQLISRGAGSLRESIPTLTKRIESVVTPVAEVKPPVVKSGILSSVANDLIPSSAEWRDRFIANSFKLAPVEDLARIQQKTGNSIGDFLARNELIKDTAKETADAVDKFYKRNYNNVRDAVAIADDVYNKPFTFSDLPEMKVVVDDLISAFSKTDTPTYRATLERLQAIKDSGEFDLLQAQDIKALSDQVDSIYKRTGEVRESMTAQAKADAITNLRRFLEERVKEATDIDIRPLNNNTMTAREIADAVAKRAGKANTASLVSLTDLSTLGFGSLVSPVAGVGALGVKKVLTSPTIQLRAARWLAGKSDEFDGMTAQQLKDVEKVIQSELRKSISE